MMKENMPVTLRIAVMSETIMEVVMLLLLASSRMQVR